MVFMWFSIVFYGFLVGNRPFDEFWEMVKSCGQVFCDSLVGFTHVAQLSLVPRDVQKGVKMGRFSSLSDRLQTCLRFNKRIDNSLKQSWLLYIVPRRT